MRQEVFWEILLDNIVSPRSLERCKDHGQERSLPSNWRSPQAVKNPRDRKVIVGKKTTLVLLLTN